MELKTLKTYSKIFSFYFFFILIVNYLILFVIVYLKTGLIIFDVFKLIYIVNKYFLKEVIILFAGYILISISIFFYLLEKANKSLNLNCQGIEEIPIEEACKIWVDYEEEILDEADTSLVEDIKDKDEDSVLNSYYLAKNITFKDNAINRIYHTIIVKYIKSFTDKELLLSIDMLKILQEHSNISSVINKFNQTIDKEVEQLSSAEFDEILKQEKENYKLLSKIDITTHTIGVIDEIFKLYKEEEVEDVTIPELFFSALFHDFGKIIPFAKDRLRQKETDIYNMGHIVVSLDLYKRICFEYNVDINSKISNSISKHHQPSIPDDTLARLLYKADKNSRKKESLDLVSKWVDTQEEKVKEILQTKEDEDNTKVEEKQETEISDINTNIDTNQDNNKEKEEVEDIELIKIKQKELEKNINLIKDDKNNKDITDIKEIIIEKIGIDKVSPYTTSKEYKIKTDVKANFVAKELKKIQEDNNVIISLTQDDSLYIRKEILDKKLNKEDIDKLKAKGILKESLKQIKGFGSQKGFDDINISRDELLFWYKISLKELGLDVAEVTAKKPYLLQHIYLE